MSALYVPAKMPENCFRCFASRFENYGVRAGFRCNLLPDKLISNCEGRSKRRKNCPLIETEDIRGERGW